MLLRQIYHDGLAQASYLIGCQATGEVTSDKGARPDPELFISATSACWPICSRKATTQTSSAIARPSKFLGS
jgi:hypothetical protein